MENQRGAATLTPVASRIAAAPVSGAPRSVWLVSPAFDLLFVANLAWLLFLVPGVVPVEGPSQIGFWQVYFLTTPHRWITLWLVALDPDRRQGRKWRFVAIALAAALVAAGVWLSYDMFVCLALVDLVWNNWHFAAQHAGILRMYSRKAGGGRPWTETWGLRLVVFYVTMRLLGWTTGWTEERPAIAAAIPWLDGLVLLAPLALIAVELFRWTSDRRAKLVYLLSVTALYGTLLVALNFRETWLVASLAVAAAVFHAVEYLAIVTHYAWRRRTNGSAGVFQKMALRWLFVLAAFVIGWGLLAYGLEQGYARLWLGVNLWASALHYAYDGMIWKLRQSDTATTLGVQIPATAT